MKKYEQIYSSYIDEVRVMPPGSALPSVRQLMRNFNTSQATICQMLNLLRNDGLIKTNMGAKTVRAGEPPARKLRVTFAICDYQSSFAMMIRRAFEDFFSDGKYEFDVVFFNHKKLPEEGIELKNGTDFLIVNMDADMSVEVLVKLKKLDARLILLDTVLSGIEEDCVCVDNRYGGGMAAHDFMSRGHENCAMLICQHPSHNTMARLAGFSQGLALHGKGFKLIDCGTPFGGNSTSSAYHCFKRLIQKEGLTFSALFCDTDLGALGVMKACQELNIKLPEQLEIIGFDNIPESGYFHPALTSIDQRIGEWAKAVGEIIEIRLNKSGSRTIQKKIIPEMVYRETTRKDQTKETIS